MPDWRQQRSQSSARPELFHVKHPAAPIASTDLVDLIDPVALTDPLAAAGVWLTVLISVFHVRVFHVKHPELMRELFALIALSALSALIVESGARDRTRRD